MFSHLSFCLALLLSLINIYLSIYTSFIRLALIRELNELIFLFLSFSLFSFIYSFITNDFNLNIISSYSHSTLPLYYKIAALWASHEGTIFLWSWILCLYIIITNNYNIYFLFLSSCLLSFFLLFTWLTSNPFLINYNYEGRDLNPLLQDPFLVIHPPILFLGYISCCIPFLLTLTYQYNIKAHFIFTYLSWTLLTLGILLGSWWAYYELGWGGYWFWDPIENIALLPWIAILGLIHAIIISNKTNTFSIWIILFSSLAFFSSLIGTFFVRSGLLSSVHTFITDKTKGIYLIIFIISALLYSIYIFTQQPIISKNNILKYPLLELGNWLLLILFIFIATTTFLPTILFDKQLSIGPDFYNSRLVPFISVILILIIINKYKYIKDTSSTYFKQIGLSLIILPLLIWLNFNLSSILLTYLSILIISMSTSVSSHFIISLLIIAIIINKEYEVIRVENLIPGNRIIMDNYYLTLLDTNELKGTNYLTKYNELAITYKNKLLGIGLPDIRYYIYQSIINNKSIAISNYLTDIYINIKEGKEIIIMKKIGMNIIWGIGIIKVYKGIKKIIEEGGTHEV